MRNIYRVVLFVIGLSVPISSGIGGISDSATQRFEVRIPAKVSITAPPAQRRVHAGGTGNLAFARQSWAVATNSDEGATVVFATNHCFWNSLAPAFKRDVQLAINIINQRGPGTWRIRVRSSRTNYLLGREVATVRADTNNVGRANLGVTVRFITGNLNTLAEGDYTTTVTGTITSPF